MSQPTHAQIRQIIAECAGVAIERVVPEARLVEELGMDALEQAEVVFAIEDELSGDGFISIEDFEFWHTVSDIYRTVEALHG